MRYIYSLLKENVQVFRHTYPSERVNERFYYTHGQLIIRGAIERKLAGLPDIGT